MTAITSPPLFYKDLVPLSVSEHSEWKLRPQETAPFLSTQHIVPITIDEFIPASRTYPIIFSVGAQPAPMALMGPDEGINIFVDDEGILADQIYVPAYVRRYPFMLAKLSPGAEVLSLCIDPYAPSLGPECDGIPLFTDGQPSDMTNGILNFCEQFEKANVRTRLFVEEIEQLELLIDGELKIPGSDANAPFVYRGFRMVDEGKLANLDGDTMRSIAQNGILPLLYAHIFSLQLVTSLFSKQAHSDKVATIA